MVIERTRQLSLDIITPSARNLQTYLDEYAFRYNRRVLKTPMFKAILDRASALANG